MGLSERLRGGLMNSPRGGSQRRLIDLLERQTERDWDLTLHFTEHGVDPDVAEPLDRFCQRLSEEISRATRSTVEVAGSVPELSELARETADHSGSLATRSASIASATEEMATTVERELAPNTQSVADMANSVAEQVRQCDHHGETALARSQSVDSGMQQLTAITETLDRQAREISEAVGLIKGIAEQTNLLSLNAAIEAARAGREGSGFAVVAEEVRNLAGQTGDTTQRVQEMVQAVQHSVAETVSHVQQVRGHVGESLEEVQAARERLGAARSAMESLDGNVRSIASATEQLSATAQSVSADVQEVATIAHDMDDKARGVGDFTHTLDRRATQALSAIGVFRLETHRRARDAAEDLAARFHGGVLERSHLEPALRSTIQQFPFFELLYVTDAGGRQITANISRGDSGPVADESVIGTDWRERAWYVEVARDASTYVTPLYRSSATGAYCFTVSVPLVDEAGRWSGVLAADVSLDTLYQGATPAGAH